MQVRVNDLDAHLKTRLAPVYLVSGDETLLVQEACDSIVQAAMAQGFDEREVTHVDRSYTWTNLLQSAASMSLFAQRRLLDVRLMDNKVDKDASAVLREYVADPAPDNLLLLRCTRLDPRQRQSAWFKALDSAGVIMLVWPVGIGELPRWLGGRLRQAKLELTPDALQYFAQRVEGNLLAAVQEIAKLKLSALNSPIDLTALMSVLEDASHYDVFELLDAIMSGDRGRVARMLNGLHAEGLSVFALLGALTATLRTLSNGGKVGGPPQRQRLVEQMVRRHTRSTFTLALAQTALIDSQGKGVLLGDEWQSFVRLCLHLTGSSKDRPLATLEDHAQFLGRG